MTDEFTIELEEVFHGPLDLLLHLVREQEVEIHEIQIHVVIEGYFEYMAHLESLDVEVAGEFLVMAATLMAIKARSLLPREEVQLEDELDPGDELIQRLIEYRKFKEISDDLAFRHEQRQAEHERGYKRELRDLEPERTLELGELTSWDLLAAFSRLMRETLANRPHRVKGDSRPLRWYVSTIGDLIHRRGRMSLSALVTEFESEPTREGLIGAFCALLELMRIGVVGAVQEQQDHEIEVMLRDDVEADVDDLIRTSRLMDEEDADSGLDEGENPAAAVGESPEEASEEDPDAAREDPPGEVTGKLNGEAPEASLGEDPNEDPDTGPSDPEPA